MILFFILPKLGALALCSLFDQNADKLQLLLWENRHRQGQPFPLPRPRLRTDANDVT